MVVVVASCYIGSHFLHLLQFPSQQHAHNEHANESLLSCRLPVTFHVRTLLAPHDTESDKCNVGADDDGDEDGDDGGEYSRSDV